jgi:hypothetical protein
MLIRLEEIQSAAMGAIFGVSIDRALPPATGITSK